MDASFDELLNDAAVLLSDSAGACASLALCPKKPCPMHDLMSTRALEASALNAHELAQLQDGDVFSSEVWMESEWVLTVPSILTWATSSSSSEQAALIASAGDHDNSAASLDAREGYKMTGDEHESSSGNFITAVLKSLRPARAFLGAL